MPRPNKRERVDRIAELREQGKTIREICEAVGLKKTQVVRYITTFGMQGKHTPRCPHCGVALPRVSGQTL